eukprot:Pompholyxophrys_punicea_v1_NODE_6_length_8794_cov_7.233894.p7 type:complete len:169 gc:universal NODE_6_length_8794_cov_7.233894:2040-1534(-)
MTRGLGLKNDNWFSTSESSCWCCKVFLAFMIRTIAASMAIERSSSTFLVLNETSRDAIGMRILRMFEANLPFAVNLSVVLILFPAGDLFTTLYLPQESECISGLRIASSKFSFWTNSSKVAVIPPFIASSAMACRVDTCRSYDFFPNVPLTVALPCVITHCNLRFWCF